MTDLRGYLSSVQKRWRGLSQTAACLITAVTAFVRPPLNGAQRDDFWWRFGEFAATLATGILIYLGHRFKRREHADRWFAVAAVGAVVTIAAIVYYRFKSDQWSCTYAGVRVVTGSESTPFAADYLAAHPAKSCEELIMDFGGDVEQIWTAESISRRRHFLELLYLLCVPLAVSTLISVLQAIGCITKRRSSPLPGASD